jgi:hypothetical protein
MAEMERRIPPVSLIVVCPEVLKPMHRSLEVVPITPLDRTPDLLERCADVLEMAGSM